MAEMAFLAPIENKQPNLTKKVEAHFNPQTLSVNYRASGPSTTSSTTGSNSSDVNNRSSERTGFGSSMSVELMFDTSTTGNDVRDITRKIINWLQVPDKNSAVQVLFQWGSFMFYGRIDSISETLDYFSEQGKPLRSTVNLSLSSDRLETHDGSGGPANVSSGLNAGVGLSAGIGVSAGVSASAGISGGISAGVSVGGGVGASVGTQPLTFSQSGQSMQSISAQAGVDWKAAASANDIENPRLMQPGTVLNMNVETK